MCHQKIKDEYPYFSARITTIDRDCQNDQMAIDFVFAEEKKRRIEIICWMNNNNNKNKTKWDAWKGILLRRKNKNNMKMKKAQKKVWRNDNHIWHNV